MPTHNEVDRFWQDWDRLTPAQRGLFRQAVAEMVEDLKAG